MIVRRIIEPVLLGSLSHIIVSFIFSNNSGLLQWDEWIVACILSVPITELNRYIDRRLEVKYDWLEMPRRRFMNHLLLISLFLAASLNISGTLYMWIRGNGFFTLGEYITINLVTLCLAMLLTAINWSVYFYNQWDNAEVRRLTALQRAEVLQRKMALETQLVGLQKGNSKITVESGEIQMAVIEHGTLRVYSKGESAGVFSGTLSQLYSQLPDHLFFQVTRDAILHRSIIKTVSPSTFGKIDITVSNDVYREYPFTISRPKAAAFRRWYNSNSTPKT